MSAAYLSSSQQALLAVLGALSRRPLDAPSVAEVARLADLSNDKAYRALKNLEHAKWAEAAPGGGWRPTPAAAQLAEGVRRAIADLCQYRSNTPQ